MKIYNEKQSLLKVVSLKSVKQFNGDLDNIHDHIIINSDLKVVGTRHVTLLHHNALKVLIKRFYRQYWWQFWKPKM